MNSGQVRIPTDAKIGAGRLIPAVGLGLWKIDRSVVSNVVEQAIRIGYRHLDSACDYGNEAETGVGIRAALDAKVCRRDELWVTSKLWNTYHAPEHVRAAAERSLKDLKVDYLDLYLIHFPISQAYVPFETRYPPGWLFDPDAAKPCIKSAPVPIIETWRAMEDLVKAGLVKQIGICNFNTSLIRDLLSQARIRPSVLQVELHPYLVQNKLVRFCRENEIAVTGFSPFGAPSYIPLGMAKQSDSVLEHPIVQEAARSMNRTPAQVVLRWAIQSGTSVVPKSANLDRLRENLSVFDFELTAAQMGAITSLDSGRRFNDPGVFCEKAFGTFFPIYE